MLKQIKTKLLMMILVLCWAGSAHALMMFECVESSECAPCESCVDYVCVPKNEGSPYFCTKASDCSGELVCVFGENGCGFCNYPDGEEPCEPFCASKQCGDDECGGSCGTCAADLTCNEFGLCESGAGPLPSSCAVADLCCEGEASGCSPNNGACFCDEVCVFYGDCCDDYKDHCESGNTNVDPQPEPCKADSDCWECAVCNDDLECEMPHFGFECEELAPGTYDGCKEGFTCIEKDGCYSYCDEIVNVTDNPDEICELSGGSMTCFDGYLTCEDMEKAGSADEDGVAVDECWWGCNCPSDKPIWSENGCVSTSYCEEPLNTEKALCSATGGTWNENSGGCAPMTCALLEMMKSGDPIDCPDGIFPACDCPSEMPIWTANGCASELICDGVSDSDEDGWVDGEDNCPDTPNGLQHDHDNDGKGDLCDEDFSEFFALCEDTGGSISECGDACQSPCGVSAEWIDCSSVCVSPACGCPAGMAFYPEVGCLDCNGFDADGDGVLDDVDNCPDVFNPGSSQGWDGDGDGIGDACDPDWDNDLVLNEDDNCVFEQNPDQEDADEDGIGDVCDDDTPACTPGVDCDEEEGGGESSTEGGVTISVNDKSRGGCSANGPGPPPLLFLYFAMCLLAFTLRRKKSR